MKEILPEIPLSPFRFAKTVGVSPNRLTRVVGNMEKPLDLVDGKIPVSEYPGLLHGLKTETLQSGASFTLENDNIV